MYHVLLRDTGNQVGKLAAAFIFSDIDVDREIVIIGPFLDRGREEGYKEGWYKFPQSGCEDR